MPTPSEISTRFFVTAQEQPQPQQQNNHNSSWVETNSNRWEPPTHHHQPPTPNSKLHDRAEIEQNSENKTY